MEIVENVVETVYTAKEEVTQKAKEVIELSKLSREVRKNEFLLSKKFRELGKKIYETHKDDDLLEEAQVKEIQKLEENLEKARKEYLKKKGAKACPKCHKQVSCDAKYCSHCGAEISIFED